MREKLEGNQYIESLYWQELKVINREKQLLLETRKAASNAIDVTRKLSLEFYHANKLCRNLIRDWPIVSSPRKA